MSCLPSRSIGFLIAAFCGFIAVHPGSAGDKVLVIGDSLTKEYRSEFPLLFPSHPAAWSARNWIEILNDRRPDQFDLGSFSTFADVRLTGHEFNWAKPGGTVREFRNFLRQTPDARLEIEATSGGLALWALFPSWRNTFTSYMGQAQKVVIFVGGNDLALGNSDLVANPLVNGERKQMDYGSIYAGTFGAASNPAHLRESIRANTRSVVQWFRAPRTDSNGNPLPPRFTGPMVLCSVPHVGCTPKIQNEVGTDPGRTAVLTSMIEALNSEIRTIARDYDMGFANVYSVTKAILDPAPFQIGGVYFYKEADNEARTRYLFSGDGFHPNTAVQAKVAQVVTDAFLEKYPAMPAAAARLSDREIITEVLGLPSDLGYVEYMTEAGVPVAARGPLSDPDKDGIPNAVEYALAGRNPEQPDAETPITIVRELQPGGAAEVLTVRWQPRFNENAYADPVPQTSSTLTEWQPVPVGQIIRLPDGSRQVQLDIVAGSALYFRLAVVREP